MMPVWISVLLLLATLLPTASRSLRHTGSVTGVVFDSLAGMPLSDAVVHVASKDPSVVPLLDTTDEQGRYAVYGLRAGRYLIGFEHEALDRAGIESPVSTFVVAADEMRSIALAIPSGATVRRLRCGIDSSREASGMLTGVVHDAGTGAPVIRAEVSLGWQAIVFARRDLRVERQHARVISGQDGAYLVCGLPLGAKLDIVVQAADHHELSGQVVVPEAQFARADFRLTNVGIVRGSGSLFGTVNDRNGKRLATGRAAISQLDVDVPIIDGVFAFRELPPGTHQVEVRAIGFAPVLRFVDVADNGIVREEFRLDKGVQQLDQVTVVGSASRETLVLSDVLRRHRASPGTIFLPGNRALADASRPSDVLRAARGFHPYIGGGRSCKLADIAVYLNGEPWLMGFEYLDKQIAMRDVLAIEAFPSKLNAPVEWQFNHGCAIVVVWTRQP